MIVSIINNKGGVGKTTTSINLSNCLAINGKMVLLVDTDPQAHSSRGLGIHIGAEQESLQDILSVKADQLYTLLLEKNIKDIIIHSKRRGLDLVPAGTKLTEVIEKLYRTYRYFREDFLLSCLKPVKLNYDYVIIDCPPGLGVLATNAIKASDFILIPCEMSRGSLDGLADLLETIPSIKGESFDNFRIFMTLVDSRYTSSNKYVMKQLASLKSKILKTRIKRNEPLNRSQLSNKDIFSFSPRSMGAKDYSSLTKELLKLWGKDDKQPPETPHQISFYQPTPFT
ncbi:MAG: ParA family protein [Candidatus Scalinduaceae bacterium]